MIRPRKACPINQKIQGKVPAHHWDLPEINFERIHQDFGGSHQENHFQIVVDAPSKWPKKHTFQKDPTPESTIAVLENTFGQYGYPKTTMSDNASIFSSDDFHAYCEQIHQIEIAPSHSATNSLAERYVQIVKSKLNKMDQTGNLTRKLLREILLHF